MKLFSATQIKNWDLFTIKNEPIASVDLMERAAKACVDWIVNKFQQPTSFKIFCGKGNNGGDGLAIARLLIQHNFPVSVYIVESSSAGSQDFNINLQQLKEISSTIYFLESPESFPAIIKDEIIIDALFGTGLNKKPSGIFKKLILHLNNSGAQIISIDIPSGLYTDIHSEGSAIIRARYTLSFQQQKLAFLIAENEPFCGEVAILDIGLSQEYYNNEKTVFDLIDKNIIEEIYVPRKAFANKGNYGYACLVVGSYGMMGAAVLSAKACLRSGVGKLACYICKEGYTIMQTAVPEAMCAMFGNTFIKDIDNLKSFDVIGIGPGIGRHLSHKQLLQKVFKNSKGPVVLDADGLNILSSYPALYKSIPQHSILTPHPKEFDRLFGKSEDDFARIELALKKAKELSVYIVLKGHHTLIATPEGKGFFNSTGNAGMATAGSGDVLTGILTGLLAQKYTSLDTCILGVYLHGLAGDIASKKMSKEAMIAGDIIDNLGNAFYQISH
ncbi:MAG TPA: NAD(P)H-hydrate dehydratase [Ginsengibacter sp.]|nr:NAD(P)H-hydrate dehydratase [Ginsengibacter sp.]